LNISKTDISTSTSDIPLELLAVNVFNFRLLSVINKPRLPPYIHSCFANYQHIETAVKRSWISALFDVSEHDVSTLKQQCASVNHLELYTCGYIELESETGKKPTSSQFRWQVKRKTKKLSEKGELEFLKLAGVDVDDDLFETFFQCLKNSFVKTPWGKPENKPTLKALIAAKGSYVYVLKCDGEAIAFAQCQEVDDHSLIYMIPTYAQEFGSFSPGIILLNHIYLELAEKGVVLDLGKGIFGYKSRFTLSQYPLNLVITAGHWSAKPVAWLATKLVSYYLAAF